MLGAPDYVQLLIGAFFGGGVTFLVAQRKLQAENVTVERAKWREKVRQLASDAMAGGHPDLWVKVAVSTNPKHDEDVHLVKLVRRLAGTKPSEWDADELAGRFALLLKHDWDRSKREASWLPITRDNLPLIGRRAVVRQIYSGPLYRDI